MATKIQSREALASLLPTLSGTTVFTNGVFDLMHVGHLRYLQDARSRGDRLVVGLNSDASVRRLKGDTRPILPQEERAELMAGLACVDYVVIFDEHTADALLTAFKPQIYAKGGDYTPDSLPEAPTVRAYGGDIQIIPFVPGRSTTSLIARIQSLSLSERTSDGSHR